MHPQWSTMLRPSLPDFRIAITNKARECELLGTSQVSAGWCLKASSMLAKVTNRQWRWRLACGTSNELPAKPPLLS
ncbi:hypothetical protein HaLaN_31565, partial [Haematococcus lacustris]